MPTLRVTQILERKGQYNARVVHRFYRHEQQAIQVIETAAASRTRGGEVTEYREPTFLVSFWSPDGGWTNVLKLEVGEAERSDQAASMALRIAGNPTN
jgi:hypothetical protein